MMTPCLNSGMLRELVRRTTKRQPSISKERVFLRTLSPHLESSFRTSRPSKKTDGSKPTPIMRFDGNGTVSPEQSAKARKDEYAAREDAADLAACVGDGQPSDAAHAQ